MQVEKYQFKKGIEKYFFEFNSEGPKGVIKKVVQYQSIKGYNNTVFNLAFGEWDDTKKKINDKTVSNNADREKILATVAATVIQFMEEHPYAIIIAVGSTPSRTRLYQMGISKYWKEISHLFAIKGYRNSAWENFQQGTNYEGFLLMSR